MGVWFFFFKQKTADEMRISDWSSDVCSSDLVEREVGQDDAVTRIAEHDVFEPDVPARLPQVDRRRGVGHRGSLLEHSRHLLERGGGGLVGELGRASCRERVCQYV